MDVAMSANIAFATRSMSAFVIGYLIYSLIFREINFSKYKNVSSKYWLVYIFLGFFGYGASVMFLSYGVLKTNLFTVASIFATIPIFVMIFEFLFFNFRMNFTKVFLILLSIFGAILCAFNDGVNLDFSLGAIYILIATILSASYIIGIARFQGELNSKELGLLLMLFASLFGFLVSFIFGFNIIPESILTFYFIVGLIIGASFNLVTSILEPWAMKNLKNPTLGSQILLLEVVFAFILGFLLFSEIPTLYAFAGSVIIVFSVAVNNYLEN